MTDREIDYEYLTRLEDRLKKLKNPNFKSKQVFDEIGKTKDQQLFELITGKDLKFEDDFCEETPISTNWLQKKVAPQTVALSKEELLRLVDNDILEKFQSVEGEIDQIVQLSSGCEGEALPKIEDLRFDDDFAESSTNQKSENEPSSREVPQEKTENEEQTKESSEKELEAHQNQEKLPESWESFEESSESR